MTAAEEPVTVGRAATGYRLYVKATECAVPSVSAPLAADLLIAHFGASPADAEAVLRRVYRTHGGPTPGRCAVTALAELCVLRGVTVTDVRRERIDDGERQPDDNAWRLKLPGTRFGLEDRPDSGTAGRGPAWSQSKGLRAAWPLNRLAELWRRDSALTPADRGGRPHGVPTSARVVERKGQDHE